MDDLKTEYHGVEIEYRADDRWYFVLDNKERSSETLSKAKQRIDSEPAERRKPVKKFKAYLLGYKDTKPQIVEVGAQAEEYGSSAFWITTGGKRRKQRSRDLFIISPENDARIAEIQRLSTEVAEREEAISVCHKKLQGVSVSQNGGSDLS